MKVFLHRSCILATLLACLVIPATAESDSLPPLKDGKSPQTIDELWAGYDPATEPIETEILKETEQDGIVIRDVRFRIGVFKGKKAMMAAYYAFPKGGTHLPALIHVHGGGQNAAQSQVIALAKRGYAALSLNWGQRTYDFPDKNTDWGGVDPSQQTGNDHYGSVAPGPKTIDAVPSGRNNNWFLLILGARRGLTFLSQQPEVDPNKLGIFGHSMGGKISFDTACIDARVKVAAPSSGPSPDPMRMGPLADFKPSPVDPLLAATVDSTAYAPKLTCPILFQNPGDDFHGTIEFIEHLASLTHSTDVRFARVPQLNHRDIPTFFASAPLWFDAKLKGTFSFPRTPDVSLNLVSANGTPQLITRPDTSRKIKEVDVYYTDQADSSPSQRFWRFAASRQHDAVWTADLPLFTVDQPLWVYANIVYALDEPATGAGYYHDYYTSNDFGLSSHLLMVDPVQLKQASIKTSLEKTLIIETFGPNWKQEWYSFEPHEAWHFRTHKLNDPEFAPPTPTTPLALGLRTDQDNDVTVKLEIDSKTYVMTKPIKGGTSQVVTMVPSDFVNVETGVPLAAWSPMGEFSLENNPVKSSKGDKIWGKKWNGPEPVLHTLEWKS